MKAIMDAAMRGTLNEVVKHHYKARPQVASVMLKSLYNDPIMRGELQKQLADLGFRRVEFLGQGFLALTLLTTENQVLRIGTEREWQLAERIKHPAILQPIQTYFLKCGGAGRRHANQITLRVEVLPRVRTGLDNVKPQHLDDLKEVLQKSRIKVPDLVWPGNIGIMDIDGKELPVLVDPGLARPYDGEEAICQGEHVRAWLDDDGRWLQRKFEPRTKASGVIDRKALEKLDITLRGPNEEYNVPYTQRPSSGQTVQAIRDDGMYEEQVAALYRRAMEKHSDGTNFSQLLKAERALMRGETKR